MANCSTPGSSQTIPSQANFSKLKKIQPINIKKPNIPTKEFLNGFNNSLDALADFICSTKEPRNKNTNAVTGFYSSLNKCLLAKNEEINKFIENVTNKIESTIKECLSNNKHTTETSTYSNIVSLGSSTNKKTTFRKSKIKKSKKYKVLVFLYERVKNIKTF